MHGTAHIPGEQVAGRAAEPRITAWVLYDGSCGVCSYLAIRFEPSLARIGFGIRPLQDPWVVERLGLDEVELLRLVRLLRQDGSQLAGPDVYREILARRWWTAPFGWLSRWPLLRSAFDGSYHLFARHRHRISRFFGLVAPDGASCAVDPAP